MGMCATHPPSVSPISWTWDPVPSLHRVVGLFAFCDKSDGLLRPVTPSTVFAGRQARCDRFGTYELRRPGPQRTSSAPSPPQAAGAPSARAVNPEQRAAILVRHWRIPLADTAPHTYGDLHI